MSFVGIGLACGLAALGASIGNAWIVHTMLTGLSRQPELENKLRTNMFIGVAMVEGLAICSLVVAFMLIAKL